jgi:Na+-driven multidrug efflux pump
MSWIFFYILVERHGFSAGHSNRDLAISNTMRNLFGFFGVFTWSFAATTNTMVSNIIGQGKKDQVIPLVHKIVRISFCLTLLIALLLNVFPEALLSMYGQEASFTADAIPVVRVVSSALVLMSFSTVWLNAVTGTGNSTVNLAIEAAAIILYCVYVYVVLEVLKLSITWGWLSEWLYWTTLFSLSFWYIRSGKWKKKEI